MKTKLFGLAAAAAVSLTLLTGCPAEEKKESTTTTTTTTETSAAPESAPAAGASTPDETQQAAAGGEGAAVYSKNNCAACHGASGEGAVGPSLKGVEAKGDDYIRETILNGKGQMPAFKGQIEGAQLDALITYVKSL